MRDQLNEPHIVSDAMHHCHSMSCDINENTALCFHAWFCDIHCTETAMLYEMHGYAVYCVEQCICMLAIMYNVKMCANAMHRTIQMYHWLHGCIIDVSFLHHSLHVEGRCPEALSL